MPGPGWIMGTSQAMLQIKEQLIMTGGAFQGRLHADCGCKHYISQCCP